MTQTLTLIRAKQAGLNVPDDASVMKHEPEMLLIGCPLIVVEENSLSAL